MYGNLRVDTLAAAALIKYLYPVKYAIFSIQTGLHELRGSDLLLFNKHHQQKESTMMQSIILTILVVTLDYMDKIVMHPGKGTFIKSIDTMFPGWSLMVVSRLELVEPGSVVEMIRN